MYCRWRAQCLPRTNIVLSYFFEKRLYHERISYLKCSSVELRSLVKIFLCMWVHYAAFVIIKLMLRFYLQQMFRWNWFSRFCFFELIYGTNNSFKVHKPASDEMVQIIKFTYTHWTAQCDTHNVQVPNVVFSWCELGFIGCKLDADLFQHPSSSLQLQARTLRHTLKEISTIYSRYLLLL